MAAKDINIRLGLIFDQKSLTKVEKALERSGQRLNRFGDALSLSISAPLLALGAGSIKAAGDLESLNLALQSQLGSASAAKKEIEALTEVAKNPGLGLEQVVRASVSLQAVGNSADKARDIITEFGNALALAGKGREEVDGVVLALTQISAKGKVSAEEINQLAERLPQIRTLMKNAFGTASTEDIQKLGVTADQFINGILVQLKELPRAQGGIKNSLENTFDSLKQSLAKVGFAINNTFDIAGSAESFGNFVLGLAETFSNLNPTVQTLAVYLAGALVAAGPLAKVFGSFQLIGSQLIGIWGGMVGGLSKIASFAKAADVAFQALNATSKAFVVIGIISAVIGIAAAMGAFSRQLTAAEKAQSTLNDVNNEAARSISSERAQIDPLIATLKDENKSRERKIEALAELNKISPKYFGNLDIEKLSVDSLNAAYDAYIENLLRAARAKAAEEKLIKNDQERLDLQEKLLRLQNSSDKAGAANTGLGGGLVQDLQAARTKAELTAATNRQIEANAAEKKALIETIQANKDLGIAQAAVITTTTKTVESSKDRKARLKEEKDAAKDLADEMDRYHKLLLEIQKQDINDILAANKPLDQLQLPSVQTTPTVNTLTGTTGGDLVNPVTQGGDTAGQSADALIEKMQGVATAALAMQEAIKGARADTDNFFNSTSELAQIAADGFASFGGVLADTLSGNISNFQQFSQAAIGAIGDLIGQLIKLAVANAIAGSLKTTTALLGPAGVALAGLAGTLAGALFKRAVGGAKFARGTQFAPGGMALVGEQGPELMNVPRGSSIASNARTNRILGGMGGGVTLIPSIHYDATGFVIMMERAEQKQARTRGY